jgi:hypothetical protein
MDSRTPCDYIAACLLMKIEATKLDDSALLQK